MSESKSEVENAEVNSEAALQASRKPWVEPRLSASQDALEVTMASGTATSTAP